MKTCYICHKTQTLFNFTGVKNKCRACVKEYNRLYRLGLTVVAAQIRSKKKQHATPFWLTEDDRQHIRDLYAKSKKKTKAEGIKYHVDHIVPLNGINMSGFHSPLNLRIITAKENLIKGNRYTGDDAWT